MQKNYQSNILFGHSSLFLNTNSGSYLCFNIWWKCICLRFACRIIQQKYQCQVELEKQVEHIDLCFNTLKPQASCQYIFCIVLNGARKGSHHLFISIFACNIKVGCYSQFSNTMVTFIRKVRGQTLSETARIGLDSYC